MQVQERAETIQDKEKRIYDLKKKNQELEKFKFVLDYKIKELKRQIEPREQDIQGMTSQIKVSAQLLPLISLGNRRGARSVLQGKLQTRTYNHRLETTSKGSRARVHQGERKMEAFISVGLEIQG